MHSDHLHLPQNPMSPLADQEGYYMQNVHAGPVYNRGTIPPFHNIDIQPSDACPRNFIIFDQINNQSHIMFHPEISSKVFSPGFGVNAPMFQNKIIADDEIKIASSFKEDSADIDALLSTELEENEGCDSDDDDVVSTARTSAIYDCNSLDSCSNCASPSKRRSFFKKSSAGCCNDNKRKRMRKMVKVLSGIVPGSNHMSTVAVLDEAVRYLKSLRVEVEKMGVGGSNG